MKYDSSIHSKAFLPKTILGNLNFFFNGFPHKEGDLLVLNYHSTPAWLNREFENQVNFLLQHFDAIHPDELKNFYSRKSVTSTTNKKPSLLFTFDDGLKNNLNAAKILEKNNVKGLFFIVPDFFNTAESEQQNYYQTHIRKIINPRVDNQKEDLTALSIREMTELVSRGHVMGSHSMSHTMSANDSDAKQL